MPGDLDDEHLQLVRLSRARRAAKQLKARLLRLRRPTRPGLDGLDMKIAEYVDFDSGFYIEAGANDGYRQSNTYFLERKRSWRGLLVEPIPELAERCKKNRPGSTVMNCALVANDYPGSSIEVRYAGLMSLVVGAQGDTQAEDQHIQDGIIVQGLDSTFTVQVPARTLSSILDEIGAPSAIDLLSLDVEGYELDVLKGLDLARHRPTVIVVEARFQQDIDEFLTANDYRIEARLSVHDLLYQDLRSSQPWEATATG